MRHGIPPVPRLSWTEVCRRRLDRHGLTTPLSGARPADIVGAMCGAHAQILSAAELSIGLRSSSLTRAEIRDALWTERSLIKTFGPRGTVHLLPTHDLPMWVGALSAIPLSHKGHTKDVRLTPEQTDVIVAAIAVALNDAALTIDELGEAVVASLGSWAGELVMPAFNSMWPRWRQAVGAAAHRGVLCFGPNRGAKVTYANPRHWLPGIRPAEREVSLSFIVRRYLHAYGPATPEQFARWLGAPPRWGTEVFDSLSGELQRVEVEGVRAWQAAGEGAEPPAAPKGVRLLPYFDAYVVGSHPRALLYPGRATERALTPSGQAGNYPVLLIDGVVAGVWHQRRTGRKLDITVEPFAQLTQSQRRELDGQVTRIGAFLECTPQLTIGTVTAGAHA